MCQSRSILPVSSLSLLELHTCQNNCNTGKQSSPVSMAWLPILSVLLVLQGGAAYFAPKSVIQPRHVMRMADDLQPVTDRSRATSTFKQVGASVGVFGLIFGKKLLDGPGTSSKPSLLCLL